jgi:hypothetical protein
MNEHDKLNMTARAITAFHNAANATFSDADHMRYDVPTEEAAKYFKRNKEEIERQLGTMRRALEDLEKLTGEGEKK